MAKSREQFRKIYCAGHKRYFRGHGVTRVFRTIVFSFCAACWKDRDACEAAMRKVAA